jgi:hypothetical protein
MNVSFSLFCYKSLPYFPKYCLHTIQFQPSILLGYRVSSSHIIVVSHVSTYNHFTLIVLRSRQIRTSTLHGVHSFLTHVIMISQVTLCTHVFDLSKRMSSPIALDDRFDLEVLTRMDDVIHWHWNLESSFLSQAYD